VEFPKEMSARVADITDGFSFAYMKEAFVAALLVIVAKSDELRIWRHRGDPLAENILWKEIKRQVENLRKEMEDESEDTSLNLKSGMWPSLSTILQDDERPLPVDIQGRVIHGRADGTRLDASESERANAPRSTQLPPRSRLVNTPITYGSSDIHHIVPRYM